MLENIIKTFTSTFTSGFSSYIADYFNNRMLEYQTELFNRCTYVKTYIFSTKPVKLDDIYVEVNLVPLALFRSDRRKKISISFDKLIVNDCRVLVVGGAGAGKTILFKKICSHVVNEKRYLPILINLRNLNQYPGNFRDYINNEIFDYFRLGEVRDKIDSVIGSGSFLFCLDGVDEITYERRDDILSQINEFILKYSRNGYLISSRFPKLIESLPQFHNYEIEEFDNQKILEFINKQFQVSKESSDKYKDKLIKYLEKDDIFYDNVLKNPLLLSMFVVTHESVLKSRNKINRFFANIIETITIKHDQYDKLGFEREYRTGLDRSVLIRFIEFISFLSLIKERYAFDVGQIEKYFSKSKEILNISFDNSDMIEDLCSSLSLFIYDGYNLEFNHKVFQQYFASTYTAKLKNNIPVYGFLFNIYQEKDIKPFIIYILALRENDEARCIEHLYIPIIDDLIRYKEESRLSDFRAKMNYLLDIGFFDEDDKILLTYDGVSIDQRFLRSLKIKYKKSVKNIRFEMDFLNNILNNKKEEDEI